MYALMEKTDVHTIASFTSPMNPRNQLYGETTALSEEILLSTRCGTTEAVCLQFILLRANVRSANWGARIAQGVIGYGDATTLDIQYPADVDLQPPACEIFAPPDPNPGTLLHLFFICFVLNPLQKLVLLTCKVAPSILILQVLSILLLWYNSSFVYSFTYDLIELHLRLGVGKYFWRHL